MRQLVEILLFWTLVVLIFAVVAMVVAAGTTLVGIKETLWPD